MKWKIPELLLALDLELKEYGRVVEKVERWQGAYTETQRTNKVSAFIRT